MSVLDLILADPVHWLWDTETQVELFRMLPSVWPTLGAGDRERLLDAIESGPPREMFTNEIDDAEWNDLREQMIWSRVARVAALGPALPERAGALLKQIEQRHPAWKLTGESRDDFPTWTEVRWGSPSPHTPEELAALSDDDLVTLLLSETKNREGLIDRWSNVIPLNLDRSIGLVERLAAEGQFRKDVWSGALRGLRSTGGKAAIRERLVGLLTNLPEALLRDVIHEAADLAKEITEDVPDALRANLLNVWDRLASVSLDVTAEIDADRLTAAINHPTGKLVEALFGILRSLELKRDQGIDEDIQLRLERVLRDPRDSAKLGRVVIASRLPLLHDLTQDWTRGNVITRFDWGDPEEAAGAWQGFLWSPTIRPSLWAALKPHFLSTFDHLQAIAEGERSLPTLLASIAIDGTDALTSAEARECLRKLNDSARSSVAWWLERRLDDAGKKAPVLWKERLGPWVSAAWPKEPALRSDGVSTHLAGAAVFAGDAFPDAVTTVMDVVGPITRAWGILKRLRQHGHIAAYPARALELVNRLTPDVPPHWFGNLRRFLDAVLEADATLAATVGYNRLNEIAIAGALDHGDDD
jgi:hypothetical protein